MNEAQWKQWTDPSDASASGFFVRPLLSAISAFYGMGVYLRNAAYDAGILPVRQAAVPVISIGNLSVGGTGKTSVTLWCAEFLKAQGKKVAVLSRGYKRNTPEMEVKIVSDGNALLIPADQAGDEPALLALKLRGVPILVGADRYAASLLAVKNFKPDVLLLDDAFQHRKLRRDLDLLCLDDATFERSRLFPRGVLREPLSEAKRAGFAVMKSQNGRITRPISVPAAVYRYAAAEIRNLASGEVSGAAWLKGRKVFAASGIAHPESFEALLAEAGADVAGALRFPDHHPFGQKDLKEISSRAAAKNAAAVVTEKDAVKLPENFPAHAVSVAMRWESGEEDLKRKILTVFNR